MNKFSFSVSMIGFSSVSGEVFATNKKEAEKTAISSFLAKNDMENELPEFDPEINASWAELINFYGPIIKKIK